MGSGTTTDKLFGGLDLKLFNDTGKIEYLVENSFMNHEFVVFEELFDAPDYILEQLKDILSSGHFRNGSQNFRIKTKLIVCCTNKTRDQFSKNDSLRALMERFPLEQEVKWNDYLAANYEKLLNTTRGYADPMLTYILQEYTKKGQLISPRIAIAAADLLASFGPDSLVFLADFKQNSSILTDSIKKFKSIFKVKDIKAALETLVEEYNTKIKSKNNLNKSDIEVYKEIISKVKTSLSELKGIKVDDSLITEVSSVTAKYNSILEQWVKDIDLFQKMDKLDSDDDMPF